MSAEFTGNFYIIHEVADVLHLHLLAGVHVAHVALLIVVIVLAVNTHF